MDPIKILPTEVFEQILSYLSGKDLSSCCSVSQKWNIAANNDMVWKELCLQNNWWDCGDLKHLVDDFGFIESSDKDAFNNMGDWKKHFVLRNRLQNNWRSGNSKDLEVCPNGNDVDFGEISAVDSDGDNILTFGFGGGVLKLFNMKDECKLIVVKECVLATPIISIQIIEKYMFVMQASLLEVYKINEDYLIDLCCVKSIKGSVVTNVDIPTLMQVERRNRTSILKELRGDNQPILHINKTHLIYATSNAHIVNIYDLQSDFEEPDIKIDVSAEVVSSYIFNLHAKDDTLFIVIGEYNSKSQCDEVKLIILAYSIRDNILLYSKNLGSCAYRFMSSTCTIESNEVYLVLRFEFSKYFLVEMETGRELIEDNGTIFLDVNCNPRLVGITYDDSFHISDPNSGAEYYCVTLDGTPLAVYAGVIVTLCVEYNRSCVGSTEIEFWNMQESSQKIESLKFPKTASVILLFKDDTKLIFYSSKNHCVVHSFLA